MRLAAALSIAALPALVAAHAAPGPIHYHNRAAAFRRQGLGDIIDSIFNPSPSSTSAPPSSSSAPLPSSTSKPPLSSSSTVKPPSSSSSSTPPPRSSSSSAAAPPSSSSSAPPSSSPTTSETPKETSSSESPSQTPSETPSSSAPPAVSVVTKTVDGVTQVVTESASTSAKPDGNGIGTGAIIGIAVGAGLVVCIIVAVIVLFARRGRRTSDDEAIRWPELNRHGDSDAVHALPAHRTDGHGVSDRRMSLGSDLDGPAYMSPDTDIAPNSTGLSGSNFGAASMLNDSYNEKYDPNGPHRDSSPYGYDDDYTSFPPLVQPQPSPVHGVRYDWETDASYSDHHNQQYAAMQRGGSHSPPMAGVGAGVVSYPPQQAHY